jgi:hypothetical protein
MIIKEITNVDEHRFNNLLRNIKQFSDEIGETFNADLYSEEEKQEIWRILREVEDKMFKAAKII